MHIFNRPCSQKSFAPKRQIESQLIRGNRVSALATLLPAVLFATHGVRMANAAELWSNFNTQGVSNVVVSANGTFSPTRVSLTSPATVTQLVTYHWNYGQGKLPGTITIQALATPFLGNAFNFSGTYPAQGQAGSYNAQNVTWVANVNVTLPAGDYEVFDSSPSTWSENSTSITGFVEVLGNSLVATTLFDNFNNYGVVNQPTKATTFKLTQTTEVTQLKTYHWDMGAGHAPGPHDSITLSGFGSPISFPVAGAPGGNGGVQNATWVTFGVSPSGSVLANLDLVLPPGTYTVSDSSPGTWSQNAESNGEGFAIVMGNEVSSQIQVPLPPATGSGGGPTPPATLSCSVPAYYVVMAPCQAVTGTPMKLTVINALPRAIAAVTLYCVGAPFGPGNFCGTVNAPTTSLLSSSVFIAGMTVTGTGIAVGNVYTFPVPAGLIVGGPSSQWEAIAYDAAGGSLGSVGIFTLQ